MELAEAGKIETIIVKDHSRLGRNRLVVGQLLEEDFVRLGVRYIAIMDNIDTKDGLSDFLPVQDWFNEMHAKNTSKKVRAVFQNKGMSGKPLTTVIPYGYKKNGTNPDEWLIDEEAAEVVRRIFRLCVAGYGPTQIANILFSEGIPTPTEYWQSQGRKTPALPAVPHKWAARTVADILERQEYIGDTVNFVPLHAHLRIKRKLSGRRKHGKSLRTPTKPLLTGKLGSLCRRFGRTNADQTAQARSVCFRACFTAEIVVKSCITA